MTMGRTVNVSSAECTHLSDRAQRGDKPGLLLTELSKLRCPGVSTTTGIVAQIASHCCCGISGAAGGQRDVFAASVVAKHQG